MEFNIAFILFILCIHVFQPDNGIYAFVPVPRYGHTAVLVDKKIYFQGGESKNYDHANFFYLDVSTTFDLNNIPWTDLSSVNNGSPRFIGASCVSEAKNDSIFFIGGVTPKGSRVEKFDILTQEWSKPNISGSVPVELTGIQCVASEDTIYIFGGNELNNLYTLSTSNLTWSTLSSSNAPSARVRYSATLLPNGDVLYIGGRYFSNFSLISMKEVCVINFFPRSFVL